MIYLLKYFNELIIDINNTLKYNVFMKILRYFKRNLLILTILLKIIYLLRSGAIC